MRGLPFYGLTPRLCNLLVQSGGILPQENMSSEIISKTNFGPNELLESSKLTLQENLVRSCSLG